MLEFRARYFSQLYIFGIITEVVGNPLLKSLFLLAYYMSIQTFLRGTYFMIYGVRTILEKGTEINVKQRGRSRRGLSTV